MNNRKTIQAEWQHGDKGANSCAVRIYTLRYKVEKYSSA